MKFKCIGADFCELKKISSIQKDVDIDFIWLSFVYQISLMFFCVYNMCALKTILKHLYVKYAGLA